jgi:heptosyltransferase-2
VAGHSTEKLIVGVHPGASHTARKWKPEHFAAVIDTLTSDPEVQVVIFEDTEGDSSPIAPITRVPRLRSSLRDLMALITTCDMLLCADSGPMHIANALGVPVTALFGPQRSEWYGPRGELDHVVQIDEMPCRPCFDACIFSTPHCMDGIAVEDVVRSVTGQLQRIAAARQIGQVKV